MCLMPNVSAASRPYMYCGKYEVCLSTVLCPASLLLMSLLAIRDIVAALAYTQVGKSGRLFVANLSTLFNGPS